MTIQLNTSLKHLPRHVAFIMDGNRRWARAHKLSALAGHQKAAYGAIEPLADVCIAHAIPYLTIWAFSTENWHRSPEEVKGLMMLFRKTLSENIDKLYKKGVRVCTIGDIDKFPPDIYQKIIDGEEKTKHNNKLTLTIALNYGGRDELVRAFNKALKDPNILRSHDPKITTDKLSMFLDTAGQPDPDLVIRTGGEKRLSGFLMWQSVYSELYFTDVLFPDFTPHEFEKALVDYQKRQRRFGT